MDKTKLIIISALVLYLAIRIYLKYVVKPKRKMGDGSNDSGSRESSTSLKNNDYEPYSNK